MATHVASPSASTEAVHPPYLTIIEHVKEVKKVPSAVSLHQGNEKSETQHLLPADHGFHAYAYLAASFLIELLVWSIPFSYGVFLNYYKSTLFNNTSPGVLSLIGTLSSGIMYMSSPLILPIINRYPNSTKPLMVLGLVICTSGMLGAAFSTKVWQLVLSQGVGYSLGGCLLYYPPMPLIFEWFEKRRGLANGVLFSGTGIGGVAMPFIVNLLLRRYGHRTTFIALAVTFVVAVLPSVFFIKPRFNPEAQRGVRINLSFLRAGAFWLLFISNIIQGLANFLPGIFLPTFTSDIGFSNAQATLVASLINGASVPGLIAIGWATDRYDLRASIVVSTFGASLSVFFLWGFASGLPLLLSFALLYGFFAGGFSAMWIRFAGVVAEDDPRLCTTIYSIFGASRGLGNILSAPISGLLLHHSALSDRSHFGYGFRNYGPLIIFTGAAMLTATLGSAYRAFQPGRLRD